MCGNAATMAEELTSGAATKTYVMPVTTMTLTSKCTWVTWSTMSGPTFVFGESAAGLGLVGSNWEIHAMEYTASTANAFVNTNGSLVPAAGSGVIKSAEGLARGNMTPLFTMPADQFATLRTWYGEGAATIDSYTGQTSSWSSVGGAPISNTKAVSLQLAGVSSQLYGNVANVPAST